MFAARVKSLKPSPTLAISAKAKHMKNDGIDIIDFSVGEPDLLTPEDIKKAGISAIEHNYTKYTVVNGILPLREAICDYLQKKINLNYSPDNIIVSTGAKQSIFNAFLATIDDGDEVILPAPAWVSYKDIIELFGGKVKIIPTTMEDHFKISPGQLTSAVTPKTKWIIINSPSNPTGTVYSLDELKDLSAVLANYPAVQIMTDDIYEELVYDNIKYGNILVANPELKERTLIINGLSKSFCMTGWRLGFAAGNQELIKVMANIQSQSTSNASSIVQQAALYAYRHYNNDHIVSMREIYVKRRNEAIELLSSCPLLKAYKPQGAFYMFISMKNVLGKKTPEGKIINNALQFAEYLLEKSKVAVVHGEAFETHDYFRISFAVPEEVLKEGLKRIVECTNQLL